MEQRLGRMQPGPGKAACPEAKQDGCEMPWEQLLAAALQTNHALLERLHAYEVGQSAAQPSSSLADDSAVLPIF